MTTNATDSCRNSTCVDDDALAVPLTLLYSVIFVLGLTGNLLALWAFFCVPSKKNSVHVFLINVAFADLLLVICLPFRILYHSQGNKWTLSPFLCQVVGHLFYMNIYVSIILLGLISVDRYLKMHHSARMKRLSRKWSTVLCAVVWFGVLATVLLLFTSKRDSKTDRCFHYKLLRGDGKRKAYINIFAVIVFWLVFISLMVSYGKIALKLLRRSQERPDLPNALCYARSSKKSFFILFVFTLCFVPYHSVRPFYIITQVTNVSCFWRNVANKANETVLLLSALNSCLDPIMYFLLSSSVRKEGLRLVNSVFRVQKVAGNSASSSTGEINSKKGNTY